MDVIAPGYVIENLISILNSNKDVPLDSSSHVVLCDI